MRNRPIPYLANASIVVLVAFLVDVVVFGPALRDGKFLAAGDGLRETLPAMSHWFRAWNRDMFLGYPPYGDPSLAPFYPLRLLGVSRFGFDTYVVSAYAVTGAALFGYVYELTKRRSAALTAAAGFSLGGFAMSHFAHPMIVHPTAWATVALWSLQRFFSSRDPRWLLGLSSAIALTFLSGQPQIAAFCIVLLTSYAAVVEWPRTNAGRSLRGARDAACVVVAIALGIMLAAVALVPDAVIAAGSPRASLSFDDYVVYAIPLEHLGIWMLFPTLVGGGALPAFDGRLPFVALGASTESALYVPAAALVLALVAVAGGSRRVVFFWWGVVAIGLALAAGRELPLAAATYHVPPFDLFRIPGRHAFEITLGLSILAGLGVAALDASPRRRAAAAAGILVVFACFVAALRDVAEHGASFLAKPPVTWFAAAAAFQAIAVLGAVTLPMTDRSRRRIACAAVAGGAVFFASSSYWRNGTITPETLREPAYVRALMRLPISPGQRTYAYSDPSLLLIPNLPWLWNVPNVSGYSPLRSNALDRYLHANSFGALVDLGSPSLDLAAIRYFAVATGHAAIEPASAPFASDDLGLDLSARPGAAPASVRLATGSPVFADRVGVVSALENPTDMVRGAHVADLVVRAADGRTETIALRAGIDTARIATVPAAGAGRDEPRTFSRDAAFTWYVGTRTLVPSMRVRTIEIRIARAVTGFHVRALSLIDTKRSRAYSFAGDSPYLADARRFRFVGDVGGAMIFENRRARPAAWIVANGPAASRDSVHVGRLGDWRREYDTDCASACVLEMSEAWNPDWKPFVDGGAVALSRADSVLQAIRLPPGRHRVDVRYEPTALFAGAAISLAAALAAFAALAWRTGARGRTPPAASARA